MKAKKIARRLVKKHDLNHCRWRWFVLTATSSCG